MVGKMKEGTANRSPSAPSEPDAGSIAAVVVTYHPDGGLPERIMLTAEQVGGVVIVDNGSGEDASRRLRRIASFPDVELIENDKNLGIAAALNQGVRQAISRGYGWVLTLDQDSRPHPEMVANLATTYTSYLGRGVDAIVAPVPVDEHSGRAELLALCDGEEDVEVETVLTSGTLLSASAFASVGPFREELFIDYVDTEHCLRARRAGHPVVLSCNARLLHNLGAPTFHRFLWKTRVVTSNHSPLRRYYITRNRLLVMKEYILREPLWTARELRALVKETVKMLLFEGDRRKKARFFLRGTMDALRNRTGEFPGEPAIRRGANNSPASGKDRQFP